MMARHLQGTGSILRLILRQDRFKIIVWLLSLIIITLSVAYAYPEVYKTEEDRMGFVLTMENPAMEAMIGPVYEADTHPISAIFAHEMLLFTVIAVAIMNILLIGRSTRTDEEDGRLELLKALPVGRLSHITAILIEALVLNLLLAGLIGAGLSAVNLDGMTVKSSLLYGSILGATGFLFACITALFAQLAKTSRGAIGLSFAVLIISYIIRAIGDVSSEALSLISPLGWSVRTGVFIDNNWWPILLAMVIGVFVAGIVFYLNTIRDLGAGFIPEMKGKIHASSLLKSPLGFVFRMQRTNLISWAIGIFLLGAAFGAVLGDLEEYYGDMELLQAFLAGNPEFSLTEQFIAMLIVIMSIFSAVPAVMAILKLKGEENKNRTEHMYSRAVSRISLMGSYCFTAVIVSFVMQVLLAVGLWSTSAPLIGDTLTFGKALSSALVFLPAIWVLIGIVVFLIGVFPKATSLIWMYFAFCFIVIYLSELLSFPDWLSNLSSFTHVPQLLIEDGNILSLSVMTIVAIIIGLIGFIGYKKRDIAG